MTSNTTSSAWSAWQAGMRKLKGGEDVPTPQSHSKPKNSFKAKKQSSTSQVQSSLDDLLNMLECPICLETADTPPIYQCSEGHLTVFLYVTTRTFSVFKD